MLPNSFTGDIKSIKTNAIMPLNLLNREKSTGKSVEDYKQTRMNDICAPYCKTQCSKNDEKFYKEKTETARKMHKVIPSLYGPNRDLAQDKKDPILEFLDLGSKPDQNVNSMQEENANTATNTALVAHKAKLFEKPNVKTLFCDSVIQVSDGIDEEDFQEGQLISLVIPKKHFRKISSKNPNSKNEPNSEDGYHGYLAEIHSSQNFVLNSHNF